MALSIVEPLILAPGQTKQILFARLLLSLLANQPCKGPAWPMFLRRMAVPLNAPSNIVTLSRQTRRIYKLQSHKSRYLSATPYDLVGLGS